MEGLGSDGQAAQLNGLLELGRNPQALQLVIGIPGQLVGTQGLALLGQCVQCVPDGGSKLRTGRAGTGGSCVSQTQAWGYSRDQDAAVPV